MMTILPPRRIRRAHSRSPMKVALVLDLHNRSKSSSDMSAMAECSADAALPTNTSSPPKWSSVAWKRFRRPSGAATSAWTAMASRPASSTSRTTSRAAAALERWFTTTSKPSAASFRAMARPMPRALPVTSATAMGPPR